MDGIKYNEDKPRVGKFLKEFSTELELLAYLTDFGAAKYDYSNWKKLSIEEYEDALSRHFLKHLKNPQDLDKDNGLIHSIATAWNSLAVMHFALREMSEEDLNQMKDECIKQIRRRKLDRLIQGPSRADRSSYREGRKS